MLSLGEVICWSSSDWRDKKVLFFFLIWNSTSLQLIYTRETFSLYCEYQKPLLTLKMSGWLRELCWILLFYALVNISIFCFLWLFLLLNGNISGFTWINLFSKFRWNRIVSFFRISFDNMHTKNERLCHRITHFPLSSAFQSC